MYGIRQGMLLHAPMQRPCYSAQHSTAQHSAYGRVSWWSGRPCGPNCCGACHGRALLVYGMCCAAHSISMHASMVYARHASAIAHWRYASGWRLAAEGLDAPHTNAAHPHHCRPQGSQSLSELLAGVGHCTGGRERWRSVWGLAPKRAMRQRDEPKCSTGAHITTSGAKRW